MENEVAYEMVLALLEYVFSTVQGARRIALGNLLTSFLGINYHPQSNGKSSLK